MFVQIFNDSSKNQQLATTNLDPGILFPVRKPEHVPEMDRQTLLREI